MSSSLAGRLKRTFLQETFRQFKKSEAKLHPLKYLFWECTLRCNLSCIHCGSDCHTDYALPDMHADVFLDQLKIIAAHYNPEEITVVVTGGEPLIRKDLPDIGMKIRKLGFRWGMVTNGFALNNELMNKLVNAGLGAITLSIDGLEDDHNWMRNNPQAFRKAIEALRLITAHPRINADVVTCVHHRNLRSLPEIMSLLRDNGLRAWRLFTITPIGRAKNHPDLELSALEFQSLLNFIAEQRNNQQDISVNFSCESYLGQNDLSVRDNLFFCRAGINIGSILADGSVSACPNIDRSLIQGSIYEETFVNIWQNRFQQFRDRRWTRAAICEHCAEWKYCQGSGLHWWNMSDKSLMKCHFRDISGKPSSKSNFI